MWLLAVLAATVLAEPDSPEARATAFLVEEVPLWPRENHCFSCHNNGDAARALFAAERAGLEVPEESLAQTLEWLASPADWDDNGGGGGFDDQTLARIQFASALAAATDAGLVTDEAALREAAAIVAADQLEDGSWKLDASESIGSPATYGRVLATATAKRVLERAGKGEHGEAVSRASGWLEDYEVRTVVDAASVLIGLGADACPRCLELTEQAEAPSGGWGPYLVSAPEAFDTALVMLALDGVPGKEDLVARGRSFLLERQLNDGSWVETTRPAGQQSYAQYISTTGWATLALFATR